MNDARQIELRKSVSEIYRLAVFVPLRVLWVIF